MNRVMTQMIGPGIVTTHTVHHPHAQPKSSGDNAVVITILEQTCVLKERTVATSQIGIRNATLMANSSDFC